MTLISKDESEESRVTKSEATEFIAKEIATKEEPESEPSGVDAEDLLDEMWFDSSYIFVTTFVIRVNVSITRSIEDPFTRSVDDCDSVNILNGMHSN